ncbi:hypothetical protein ILUMI_06954, partial [Ignelater luminosus]
INKLLIVFRRVHVVDTILKINMLYFLLISFSLILSGGCSSKSEEVVESYKTFIKNRCVEKVGSNTYFESSVNTFLACVHNSSASENDEQSQKPDRCMKDVALVLYGCFESFVKEVDACLESEEKYLPNYILELFNKTFSIQCDNEERLIEDNEKFRNSACFNETQVSFNITSAINENCIPNIKTLKQLSEKGFVLKESEICSDTKSFKKCMTNEIKKICQDQAVLRMFLLYVVPAVELCEQHGH